MKQIKIYRSHYFSSCLMLVLLTCSMSSYSQSESEPETKVISSDLTPGFGTITPEVIFGRQVAAALSIGLSTEINLHKRWRVYGGFRHSVGEMENAMNELGDQHTNAGELGFTYYFSAQPLIANIKVPVRTTVITRGPNSRSYTKYTEVYDQKMHKWGIRGGALGYSGTKSYQTYTSQLYFIDPSDNFTMGATIRSRNLAVYTGIEVSLIHNVLISYGGKRMIGRAQHSFFADIAFGADMQFWPVKQNSYTLYAEGDLRRNTGFRVGYIYHSNPKYKRSLFMKGEFGNLPGFRASLGDCFYMFFSMGKDFGFNHKKNRIVGY